MRTIQFNKLGKMGIKTVYNYMKVNRLKKYKNIKFKNWL